MIGASAAFHIRCWPDAVRWGGCFALALTFHAAGAAALLARLGEDSDLVANAPVVMVELAPVPVSPNITPNELPPGRSKARRSRSRRRRSRLKRSNSRLIRRPNRSR